MHPITNETGNCERNLWFPWPKEHGLEVNTFHAVSSLEGNDTNNKMKNNTGV